MSIRRIPVASDSIQATASLSRVAPPARGAMKSITAGVLQVSLIRVIKVLQYETSW